MHTPHCVVSQPGLTGSHTKGGSALIDLAHLTERDTTMTCQQVYMVNSTQHLPFARELKLQEPFVTHDPFRGMCYDRPLKAGRGQSSLDWARLGTQSFWSHLFHWVICHGAGLSPRWSNRIYGDPYLIFYIYIYMSPCLVQLAPYCVEYPLGILPSIYINLRFTSTSNTWSITDEEAMERLPCGPIEKCIAKIPYLQLQKPSVTHAPFRGISYCLPLRPSLG